MSAHTYDGHVFLSGRNRGTSLRLTGKLVLVTVFVDVRNSRWTEREMQDAGRHLQKAAQNLIQGARRHGKTLSVERRSYRASIDTVRGIRTASDQVTEQVCRNIGFRNALELHVRSKQAAGADEAVLLLLIREDSRSFARMHRGVSIRPARGEVQLPFAALADPVGNVRFAFSGSLCSELARREAIEVSISEIWNSRDAANARVTAEVDADGRLELQVQRIGKGGKALRLRPIYY